jgi:hypothetical protein
MMGPSPVRGRPIFRREEMRTRITHRKEWSESIGGTVYNKAKRMLENE